MQNSMSVPPSSMTTSALGLGPRTPEASLANAAENMVFNELGGKAIEKPIKALKGLYLESAIPGLIAGPLSKLEATYSMYKIQTIGDRPVSQFIENTFAALSKIRQQERSQSLAYDAGMRLASKASGRAINSAKDPNWMANQIKIDIENGLTQAYKASNDRAQIAIKRAKLAPTVVLSEAPEDLTVPGNPVLPGTRGAPAIPPGPPMQGNIVGPDGKPTMVPGNPGSPAIPARPSVRVVYGEIPTQNIANQAQEYLLDRQKIYGDLSKANQSDAPMIELAKNILDKTHAKLDPRTGAVLSAESLGFEEAWQFKQAVGKEAFRNYRPKSNDPSAVDYGTSRLQKFYSAIDSDIENGLSNLPKGVDPKKEALKAYREAKTIVDIRHKTFGEAGLNQILKTTNTPIPEIDSLLADQNKLQRAMRVGKIVVGGKVISSSNLRKDLAGYKIAQIFEDAYIRDPINPNVGRIDPQALTKEWNTPKFQETKNKLFNKQMASDLDTLLKNASKTAATPPTGFSGNKMWPLRAGMAIAPGLVTGAFTNSMAWGLGVESVTLGGHALAKLMNNPKRASQLIALSKGSPLGMSDQAFARVLAGDLVGEGLTLNYQGGKTSKGSINSKGEYVPDDN
jgi:hypothetical protein